MVLFILFLFQPKCGNVWNLVGAYGRVECVEWVTVTIGNATKCKQNSNIIKADAHKMFTKQVHYINVVFIVNDAVERCNPTYFH